MYIKNIKYLNIESPATIKKGGLTASRFQSETYTGGIAPYADCGGNPNPNGLGTKPPTGPVEGTSTFATLDGASSSE